MPLTAMSRAEPFVLVELVGWGPPRPRDAEKLVNQLVEYLAEQGFEPVPVRARA